MAATTKKREHGNGGAETHFAKKLAHNEKKVRDKAVKKLRIWLSSSHFAASGLKELDVLKLWKGLFYCMWMSDKPKVQEELAEAIAQLLHNFHSTASAFEFLAGFFKTMHREWHGIDRLRLDKFYMLIRKFVYHSILLLKNHDWDETVVSGLTQVLETCSLCPHSESVHAQFANGIQIHVIQVYLDEVFKVDLTTITNHAFLKLLEPFSRLMATTTSQVTIKSISQNIFNQLFERNSEDDVSKLKFDFGGLSEQFFTLASRNDIQGRNRNTLYEYIKKFKKVNSIQNEKTGDIFITNNNVKDCVQPGSVNEYQQIMDEKDLDEKKQALKEEEKVSRKRKSDLGKGRHSVKGKREDDEPEKFVGKYDGDVIKTAGYSPKKTRPSLDQKQCLKNEDTESCDNNSVNGLNDKNSAGQNNTKNAKSKNARKRKHDNVDLQTDVLADDSRINHKQAEKRKKLGIDGTTEMSVNATSEAEKNESKKKKGRKGKKETLVDISRKDKEHGDVPDDNFEGDELDETQGNLDGSYLGTIPKNIFSDNPATKLQYAEEANDVSPAANSVGADDSLCDSSNGVHLARKHENLNQQYNVVDADNFTPLSTFFRHSRRKVNTEPKKTKKQTVIDEYNSAPGNRKQVRIELSRNTCHTTRDYRRNLKCSPALPYDSTKKPVQSSLKIPPAQSTVTKNKGKQSRSVKRLIAADFF